jgi:hypothetical protein
LSLHCLHVDNVALKLRGLTEATEDLHRATACALKACMTLR